MPHRAAQFKLAKLRPHATIAAVLAVLAPACAGPTESAASAPTSALAAAPAAAPASEAPAVAARARTARIPLMLFPHDSNFLLSVNVARVTASPIYDAVLANWVDNQMAGQLDKLKEMCSINLKTAIGRVLSAHTFDDEFEHKADQHMFSVDGLRRDVVRQCTQTLAERKLTRGVVEDGPFHKVETTSGPRWYVWLDDDTVVVPTAMNLEQLRARHDSAENLHNNVAMADLAHLVERDAAVWFILRIPDGRIGQSGMTFESVYGWVHLGQGLDARVGFRHPDRESARKMTAELAKNIDQLINQSGDMAKYFEGLEVGSQDTDMLVTLTLDHQQLAEFLDKYGALFSGILGP